MEATYIQTCKFIMQKSTHLNVLITRLQKLITLEQHPIYVLLKTDTDHNSMILSFSTALVSKNRSLSHALLLGKLRI